MPNGALSKWILAFRLRTLPLSLSGVGLANLMVFGSGKGNVLVALLSLLTALLLQVLSNLANDYGDYINGADNAERVGPKRAVQSGDIAPSAMKRAVWLLSILSFLGGISLLIVSLEFIGWQALLIMLTLGVLSILAAIKYTGGSNPYGYMGFGDIAVFLFFGLLSVLGTAFLHIGYIELTYLLPACGFGLLSTGVLNVNNMRDLVPDKKAGKITIAVRLGLHNAKIYHAALMIGGICCYAAFAVESYHSNKAYLCLFPGLLILLHLKKTWAATIPEEFDKQLKPLALSTAIWSILLGIGLFL